MIWGIKINGVLISLLLCAVLVSLSGCAGAPGLTENEVDRRHYRAIHANWLMLQDDIDAILLIDRPSRLSNMFVR